MRSLQLLTCCVLALGLLVVGCNKFDQKAADKQAADKMGGESTVGDKADPIEAELAKLPAEDAAAARKQAICPVGGAKLGSMGPPVKVNIEGRDVYLCCEHCEPELKADPEKFLAKIKE